MISSNLIELSFIFVCRNSILTWCVGISYERALFWHKILAYLSILCGAWHGKQYQDAIGYLGPISSPYWTDSAKDGLYVIGSMILLLLTSLIPIRKYIFELFMQSHQALILVYIQYGQKHNVIYFYYLFKEAPLTIPENKQPSIGIILWIIDIIIRLSMILIWGIKTSKIEALPADIVRLSFPKGNFNQFAGQYVFINIPSVDLLEWHPFSLSSSPQADSVKLHVRILGNWTNKLYQIAKDNQSVMMFVDGPQGEPEIDLYSSKYKTLLLISGGIGITPMQSICNQILYQFSEGRDIDKIQFIWSCADKNMVNNIELKTIQHSDQRLPLSFQPDMLIRHSTDNSIKKEADILDTRFYLTRCVDQENLKSANIKPLLEENLKMGRVDLDELFTEVKEGVKLRKCDRVGVCVCGPLDMCETVKRLCFDHSYKGISFEFHSENFQL